MKKLVFVDDKVQLLKTIEENLEDDFEIHVFEKPSVAIQNLAKINPDIIISDQIMPGEMRGLEFLQKSISICPKSLRLLTSAFVGEEGDKEVQSASELSIIDDFIAKPFNINYLKERIMKGLSDLKHKRERDREIDTLKRQQKDLNERHETLMKVKDSLSDEINQKKPLQKKKK